ncbi:MAG: response regulator transcription factor [bacterium]|nr:response regulator transcription factor [bacterium]
MRILLVEDEIALADALQYKLKQNKYQVDVVYDGISGEDYALSDIYDVLILDRMLPGKEGLEILRSVRSAGITTPAMFLTARDTVNDRVDGLDAGADDYLIKPFSNKEFLARVNALARRSLRFIDNDVLTIGCGQLHTQKSEFTIDGETYSLTNTEAALMELLIRNKELVLSKEQIMEKIWGFDHDIELANVELYIFYLRKKLPFAKAGIRLLTVRGIGYMLTEKAEQEKK